MPKWLTDFLIFLVLVIVWQSFIAITTKPIDQQYQHASFSHHQTEAPPEIILVKAEETLKSKLGSVIVKSSSSGYTCVLAPDNNKYFANGQTVYMGSSEMLKIICEYLKRPNLVHEIIPKSRKLTRRLIYESHLLNMVELRNILMQKLGNGLLSKTHKFGRFNIDSVFKKAFHNFLSAKGPSFIQTIPIFIRRWVFSVNIDGIDTFQKKVLLSWCHDSTLRKISRHMVDLIPKYMLRLGNSREIEDILKDQYAVVVFKRLKHTRNTAFSDSISTEMIRRHIEDKSNLFSNYENCFVNSHQRPMIGCKGFIKNMSGPLFNSIVDEMYYRVFSGHSSFEEPKEKKKIIDILSKRLKYFLHKL